MSANASPAGMPTRLLGSTGEWVSAIGMGGWHLGLKHVDEQLSLRIVREGIDNGITFLDNSWDYNDGASETRMGKALRDGYRSKVFLMTKIDGRSRREATRQLEESLRRLQTDCIDLVQHHEILRYEDPHRIFDEEGANAALLEARQAGKLRYIGFTGHKDPHIHLHMLEVAQAQGFSFDTVQMPLNVMDAHYRSFERLVLPELVGRKIGVLAMKTIANGLILRSRTVTCDRVPALCAESADLGRHHRNRQPRDPRTGPGDSAHVQANERGRSAWVAGEDSEGGVAGGIRAVQDDVALRCHGHQSRVVG
jgi:aryl-alcohol dehydrogenase-like predicted oxidoreductase